MKQLIEIHESGRAKAANRVTWLDAPTWVSRTGFWLSMFLFGAAGLVTYFGGSKWVALLLFVSAAPPFTMIGAKAAWAAAKNRQRAAR